MGKRGRESSQRKDGNQDSEEDRDNQRERQPDPVPSTKQTKKKSGHCSRNTGSSSKDYSDPKLRCQPLVVITQEYKFVAEEALSRISTGSSKLTGTESSKESSSSKQSSTKLARCEKSPQRTVRLSKRTPKKVEVPVSRKSPRRNPPPKLISSCKTSPNTQTLEAKPKKAPTSATTAPTNKSRRKALVRAITHLRNQSKLKRRPRRPKPRPEQNSHSPPVKRALRERKVCQLPTAGKPVLAVPPTKSRKMDKPKDPKEKEEETKSSNSSNESSNDAQDEDSTTTANNHANNESDSDDVEMQVLEKQVLSDKEEENDELPETSMHLPFVSDEESGLLSPSALPASSLFRSPSRRKKRSVSSGARQEQTSSIAPPSQQTHEVSLPIVNTSKSNYSTYKKSLPSKAHHRTNYSSFSSTSSFTSKLALSSFSQYPGKRGRGRPRKALEDVKSVSGKLYRKKLAEMVGTIGVGRGRPIYSPNQTTTSAFPSTSYEHDKTPYDDNFDDDPMAATFTPPSSNDQDIGRRMQRWQNRSTFIYAKHKFRNSQDNENGSPKDKFMCKVCKVGFTALSSLKRHYGTIYHKQQEQTGRGAVDFLATSTITDNNSMNRNDFRLTREILPSSSSSSPSLTGGRRGPGGHRPSSQPKITSFSFSRNKADNIKKYYAAADAARRRREGVDGIGGGSWIQKQQRRRKPLAHTDYIYHQSDLPAMPMGMEDDDSYFLDEMEMGEVRDDDIENNYPAEYEDLIRTEEQQSLTKKSWLSNVWKGVGPPHFTCEFCNESFTEKKEFTRHLFKHRQEEALTCPECQLRLPNESALENHKRLSCNSGGIDGVRSQFKCNMCVSAFSRLEYLKHHLEIHMRPPVRCPHCPKKFSQKFFLQDHIKAMHEWTNHNGNGNGLAMVGLPGMGSAAPTEVTLTSVIFPRNISPKPKIELFCPAAPLISTDNRRKSSSDILAQNFPQIQQAPLSIKKIAFAKPLPSPASKTVSSTSKSSSLSDHHVLDVEDVGEQGKITEQVESNNEASSSPRSRPKECVNLFKSYFHDESGVRLLEESKETDDSEGNVGVDPLADVEQSTTEDGNLVWQFKPSFDSGLGESEGNIPSLTIEIPRDKIDFDEEEKEESKLGGKTSTADQTSKSYSVEQHPGKNQPSSLLERVSLPSTTVSSFGNLPLLGCGCKSSVLEKPLESPLVCQDCGKSFEHRKSLVKHVRYYSQSEDYNCTLCSKTFKLKHHVSRHMKSFHNVDNSSTSGAEDHSDMDALSSPSGSNSGGIMTPTEKDSFSGITFEGKFASGITSSPSKRTYSSVSRPQPLPKKIRKRLESSPAIPVHGLITYAAATATASRKKSFSDASSILGGSASASSSTEGLLSSATAIVASDGISAFKCLICKKLYPSKHQLNSHMWYHKKKSTIMPYKCMDCSVEFKLKHDLNVHQQQMHSSIGPSLIKHNCSKCPAKNFPSKKDLLKHMREKHSYLGRKPPTIEDDEEELKSTDKIQVSRCPFCPLVFPRESDLKEHMGKEHMRCIGCNDCGLVLGSKDQLEEHMEKEHGHRRQESEKEEEEEEEDDDDDEDSPPTPSPHTSPIHISSFGREDDEDVEEEEDEDTQEDPESEFELLELN